MERSIRPIRDFGDEAEAYWVEPYLADGTKSGSLEVSPQTTATYDAVVVFEKDTFPLTGTVLVHETFKSDTLYEVVCQSSEPYNSTKSPLFTNLDISTPTVDYDTFSVNPHTIHGCDSIVTLLLKVVGDCENFYRDSICPIVTQHDFLPFDTTFLPGTISGVYEHHGKKTVEGTEIDTVAYYDLTIMPEYHLSDDLHLCLEEETTVIPYEENEHVTITITNGHIALVSDSPDVVIDSSDKVNGNFVLVMTTDFGCDSLVNLHIDTSVVKFDTIQRTDIFYLNANECTDRVISKKNGSNYYLPLNNYYYYSCSQQIFTPSEVGVAGPISTISFNYASTTAMTAKTDVKIYMAHTSKNNFTGNYDWVSPSSMTLVYDGELNCATQGWNEFFLNQTFDYNGSDNLLVMVLDESGSYDGSSRTFYYTNTPSSSYKTLSCGSNSYWTTSRSGNRYTYRSDIRFYGCTDEDVYYSTELAGKTFTVTEGGTYTITDTVIGSNGCDSITTRILVVEEPHKDEICDSTFTTDLTWVDNVGPYCWHYNGVDNCIAGKELDSYGYYEFPGKKTIDGVEVDTISYLKLTINPTYRDTNTVTTCLYEEPTEITYSVNGGTLSLSLTEAKVTVTNTVTGVTVDTIDAAKGDFALKMQTVKGCDSVIVLHIDRKVVARDTVYKDTLYAGTSYTTEFADKTFTVDHAGTYTIVDTVPGSNGCDSITVRYLIVEEPHEDEICDSTFNASHVWVDNVGPYCWPYNGENNCIAGKTVNSLGYYEFPGTKTINGTEVDTISYLKLTINPTSRDTDTVTTCLYEEPTEITYSVNGGTLSLSLTEAKVTVTNTITGVTVDTIDAAKGDFALKMQTVKGCDSVIVLHIDRKVVARDTVYKDTLYAGTSYTTEFADKTFTVDHAGTYTIVDTVPGSNGCDSITVRYLIVEEPHYDTICEASYNTTTQDWVDNVTGYCWHYNEKDNCIFGETTDANGFYHFPGHKTINGTEVDTISYLKLTVKPVAESSDNVDICLYEESTTLPYDKDSRITINVSSTSGVTLTSSNPTAIEVVTVDAANGDFILKTTAANGCDSVITFHVDYDVVKRDTVYADTLHILGEDFDKVVANHTFHVTEPGVFTFTDTIPGGATNSCDSITTRILIVEELHYDTICEASYNTTTQAWVDNVTGYCWHYNEKDNCIFGETTDANGFYHFPGKKTINGTEVDTISYLKLTVKPVAEGIDNVDICLYEESTSLPYDKDSRITINVSSTSGVTLTSSNPTAIEVVTVDAANGDFILKTTAANGCDSVITFHVDYDVVKRDTVYADTMHVTGEDFDKIVAGHTFHVTESGVFTFTDTIHGVAANGCDSIIVRYLIVEKPHEAEICDSTFNVTSQTWTDNVESYEWNGNPIAGLTVNADGYYEFPGEKTINGTKVDTTTYLKLTIDPTHRDTNALDICLLGSDSSFTYEGNTNVTISVTTTTTTTTVTSTDATKVTVYPVKVGGEDSKTDFILLMKTVDGCDSVEVLHIETKVVPRDTVYADTLHIPGEDFDKVVANHTFHVTEPGEFTFTDTIPGGATNSCDSITTRILIVEELHKDEICQEELATYTWRGNTLPASTDSHGYYEFPGVKVIDGHNVDTISYLKLTVHPNPTVSLASLTDLCLGSTGGMKATVTTPTQEPYQYAWTSTSALTFTPASITVTATSYTTAVGLPTDAACGDEYPVTVTLTDANGCEATANATVTVKTPAKPVISTMLTDDALGCNPVVPTLAVNNFTVTDECNATATVTLTNTHSNVDCQHTQVWTASYENACGLAADNVSVTYTWTVDATKPVITVVTNSNPDGACNPTITAPTFKVNDNCAGELALPTDSIIDGGVVNTSACGRSQTWTAHYTDPCGNKATDVSVTYTWTEDNTAPEIHTEAVSNHKGCNPVIVTPTFTVTDNCEGTFVLNADSVTTTGKTGTGCEKSQSWTAHYTDGCGNPAAPLTVTYYWKEDTQKPVIATTATDSYLGCDPTTIIPPTFTVSDNCEGDFALPTDSVTDGGVVAVTGEPQKFSRTWTAHYTDLCGNKADNVSVTYTWVEAPTVTITCPPDVRDTLAYGDCVMNIYPAEIGTPEVNAPAGWPMTVSNNIPADNLYQEGETIITWVATDGLCGQSASCSQKVIVVFPQCPDAIDCEGNVYHSVRIDCECWTQTNLVSNCYGDAHECEISGNCDDPIPCVYEYETSQNPDVDANVATFGKLYCDSAALKDSVVNPHGHIQGICPEGWYLPTPEQYESLNLHGADALKSPLYWTDGGGNNSTEFTWLPAGWWNGALQRFEGLLSEGYFWSVEIVHGEVKITAYQIHHDCDSVIRVDAHTGLGYSVRCIKEKD